MKSKMLMISMILLLCLTGCKTAPVIEESDSIIYPIPDMPLKPNYTFVPDMDRGVLYLSMEDGKALLRYVTDLKAYSMELRLLLEDCGEIEKTKEEK
jgi:hypothetical protein